MQVQGKFARSSRPSSSSPSSSSCAIRSAASIRTCRAHRLATPGQRPTLCLATTAATSSSANLSLSTRGQRRREASAGAKVCRGSSTYCRVGSAVIDSAEPVEPNRKVVSIADIDREIAECQSKLDRLFEEGKPPPKASSVAKLRNRMSSLEVKKKEVQEYALHEVKVKELKKLQREQQALQKAVMSSSMKSTKGGKKLKAEDVGRMADAVEHENAALRELVAIRQEELSRHAETSQIERLEMENQRLHKKLESMLSREKALLELRHQSMKDEIVVSENEIRAALNLAQSQEEPTEMQVAPAVEEDDFSALQGQEEEEEEEEEIEATRAQEDLVAEENFYDDGAKVEDDEADLIYAEDGYGENENNIEEEGELLVEDQVLQEEVTQVVVEEEEEIEDPFGTDNSGVVDESKMNEELTRIVTEYEKELQMADLRTQEKLAECEVANLKELEDFGANVTLFMERHRDDIASVVPATAIGGSEVCVLLNRDKAVGASEKISLMCRYNENKAQESRSDFKEMKLESGNWVMWIVKVPHYAYEMKIEFYDGNGWSLKDEDVCTLECLNALSKEQCVSEMKKSRLEHLKEGRKEMSFAPPQTSSDKGNTKSDSKTRAQEIRQATMRLYSEAAIGQYAEEIWEVEGKVEPEKEVKLWYNARAGPLAGQENLVLHWGYNAWSTKGFESQFKLSDKKGGTAKEEWYCVEIKIPKSAVVVDFVVSSNGRYDNNVGLDFHIPVNRKQDLQEFWASQVEEEMERERKELEERIKQETIRKRQKKEEVEIYRAKALEKLANQQQEIVATTPAPPKAGSFVTLSFNLAASKLPPSHEVEVEISFNRRSHALKLPRSRMERTEDSNLFEVCLPTPSDAYVMDVKFFGEHHSVDDHAGFGYHIPLENEKVSEPPMHIVHVAVEMAPVAKVGGLGDVVTSIGRAVQDMDNIVEVILPKYDTINYDKVDGFHEIESFSWGGCTNRVFTGLVEDLQVYFIQPGNGFFDIGMIYGADWEDIPMMDSERFGFFSKAALEFMLQSGRQPDIIHCHDWSTAITAKSYWDDYHSYGLPHSSIVFTIHNMGYGVDLIAQAMQFSQKATTVSPTYAQEILHEGAIQHAQQKFHGIRNGIDIEIWDASDDKHLPMGYTSANVVEGKAAAKTALKQRVGLQNVDVPLIGIVSRLTLQKGVELMEHAIWTALSRGCQVVVLGSAFDPKMQQHWVDIELSLRHQYHDMARLIFAYDEPLSHLIYAGSDMLLIPSTFEPCGLTQLISMRYGTVPIVRHTGGLRDTVFDVDFDKERAAAQGMEPNGFAFEGNDTSGLDYALHRAIDCCYNRNNDNQFWNNLAKTIMEQDWSWNEPALTYMALYYAAMER